MSVGKHWTEDEDHILRLNYPLRGPSWEGWATALPNRSKHSLRERARKLGLRASKEAVSRARSEGARNRVTKNQWTVEEIALITTHYPANGIKWEGWKDVLPGRSANAIQFKAHELKLTKNPRRFTDGERAFVLKGLIKIADALNRRPEEVAREVERLGSEYRRRV